MKNLARIIYVLLVCTIFLGNAKPEKPGEETSVDFDLSIFNRSITYAQMVQVFNDAESYDGKIFRVTGKFNYSEKSDLARIIFNDKSGCCEVAMQFSPAEAFSILRITRRCTAIS